MIELLHFGISFHLPFPLSTILFIGGLSGMWLSWKWRR